MADYLFPRDRRSFQDTFPELENIIIDIEYLRSGGQTEKNVNFTKETFPGHGVSCINPVCKNGGLSEFTLPRLIKKLIATSDSEITAHEFCRGGLYRGKTRYNACGWSYKIKVTIQRKHNQD